jgi:hypothetical protein
MTLSRGRFAAPGFLPAFAALALALGAAPASAGPDTGSGSGDAKRPTNAALRKAFENNARSVVEVVGPHRSGAGVVVGRDGQVLTSVEHVGLEQATVRVGGQSLPARVVMANAALRAAVVVVDPPRPPQPQPVAAAAPGAGGAADGGGPAPAPSPASPPPPPELHPPAVRLDEVFQVGTELVAIERDPKKGELRPHLVKVSRGRKATSPFVEVNAPLPAGTPLFDGQGRLVAMAVQRRKASARALPIPEVKGLLAEAPPP